MCQKAKVMIPKCLNKVAIDTKKTGAHACHFLLGYNNNKTSRKFTPSNLHCTLGWLTKAIKESNNIDESLGDQS